MKRLFMPLILSFLVLGFIVLVKLAPEREFVAVATIEETDVAAVSDAPDIDAKTNRGELVSLADTDLVPHRALYSMRLLRGGGIMGASGLMTMSIEQTCEGWVFTQDMDAVFAMDGGLDVRQKALSTSWESIDGSAFQFASRIETDGIVEQARGRANFDGDVGSAAYDAPAKVAIALDTDTLFPISHTAWLIEQAKAGERQASRVVFAGSEELAPELINAFIGNTGDEGDTPQGVQVLDNPLTAGEGWPMTLAFYDVGDQEGVPTFEMRTLQLANGVAPWLVMDFGDFSTLLVAEKLEPIDPPSC